MKKSSMIILVSAGMLSVSCVNKDYDLNRLDKEMTLFEEEGIEIPLSGVKPNTISILQGNEMPESITIPASSATVEAVRVEESTDLSKGMEMKGEISYNLRLLPEIYRSGESFISFDDESKFTIELDNESVDGLVLSCDVTDGSEEIGHFENIPVGKGKNCRVELPFNAGGLKRLPETVMIKGIVLKSSATKSSGHPTGIISFGGAEINMSSVLASGSEINLNFQFDDIFDALGISLEDLADHLDATSALLTGTVITNIPVSLHLAVSGDISTEINFTSPTPAEGTEVSAKIKCACALCEVSKVVLSVKLKLLDDVDLKKVDSYVIGATFDSIRFDEGVTVKSK